MAPQKKKADEENHDEELELEMDLDDDDEWDVSLRPRGSSVSAPLSSSSVHRNNIGYRKIPALFAISIVS